MKLKPAEGLKRKSSDGSDHRAGNALYIQASGQLMTGAPVSPADRRLPPTAPRSGVDELGDVCRQRGRRQDSLVVLHPKTAEQEGHHPLSRFSGSQEPTPWP